jgi:Ca2+ transporting ATPase
MDDAYVRSTEEVLKHFQVTEQGGLSESAVETSRQKHGKNGMQ